ncbi:hypothetical protein ACHQM5_004559 [Ranunculus cassubicifolius]
MQSDNQIFPGGYTDYGLVGPDLGPNIPQNQDYLMPYHGVELQPSEICPKNFIIFDQTDNKSRIMYHPAFKQNFTYPYHCPTIDINGAYFEGHNSPKTDIYNERNESSSSLKEDTRDIDALMSLEEEDKDEEDDEVNSTARTFGNYNCSSPDSCSNSSYSKSNKKVCYTENSYSECCSSNQDNEKQRRRMKKMVKALRGIVPGADKMTTGALIDEAVTYLKSLKMEVKKLGHDNFRN